MSGINLNIQDETRKNSGQYKYLGSLIMQRGKDVHEIEYRTRPGKTVIQKVNYCGPRNKGIAL